MGFVRGHFHLSNPVKPDLHGVERDALVDTGAVHLCLPSHLVIQLELVEIERREVVQADGRRLSVPYVGPVEIRFRNRRCFTGAIPLEDMDLVVRPQRQSVDVNPESPIKAVSLAK